MIKKCYSEAVLQMKSYSKDYKTERIPKARALFLVDQGRNHHEGDKPGTNLI